MQCFITGSRVYGTVTPKSDVDLVIHVDSKTADVLRLFSDEKDVVRFGKLNLIICETELEMSMWKLGTCHVERESQRTRAGIPKGDAKEIFDRLRCMVGLEDNGDSGR